MAPTGFALTPRAPGPGKVWRTLWGALASTLGVCTVSIGLWAMNGGGAEVAQAEGPPKTSFSLPEIKKKPPPRKKPKPRRRKARRRSSAKAPPVAVSTALTGAAFGLAALEVGDSGPLGEDLLGATDDVTMTEDTVDVRPQAVERVAPAYPARARRDGVEGEVLLNLLIGPDGRVLQARVLEARPAGVFDEAALGAVRRWRFSPALYRGEPVKTWAAQRLHFELR